MTIFKITDTQNSNIHNNNNHNKDIHNNNILNNNICNALWSNLRGQAGLISKNHV